MNTEIVVAAEGADAAQAFAAARGFVAESEARFTRFSETSELMRLNRSGGAWFQASPDLYAVVEEAFVLTSETQGLFDPAVYDDILALGYDRSFDVVRRTGSRAETARRAGHGSLLDVDLDPHRRAIRLPLGVRLDLGGIAKGWIAENAARRMADFVSACAVNAGGDLYVQGTPGSDDVWTIGLEDPRVEGDLVTMLRVASGAVATSSRARRRWLQGDAERHHLVDPRSGLPSATEWLSVTALAPHAAAAEAYAKALHLAGPQGAAALAESRPDVVFLVVDEGGQLWGPSAAKEIVFDGMGPI